MRGVRDADGPVVVGLDIGGTQIRAAAILSTGERLGRRSVATPLAGGLEAVYSACVAMVTGAMANLAPVDRDRVLAIGISCAGPVNPWLGRVLDPPNVRPLHDAFLADELEVRLHLPVYLERDTNVAALGEQWLGAARGCLDFIYVTVSTGLGGAVVADGRLLLGPDGTAGEIGHVTLIEGTGPRCGCGGIGHLEAISSGSGLAGQARDYLASAAAVGPHGPTFLEERAAFAPLTGRDVAEGELAGDSVCTALMERARRAFAIACVGWVNTFNPERIVVGGTVAQRQGERWLAPARAEIAATGLRSPSARVQIMAAELGEDVGLVGAWPLVRERHGKPAWRSQRAGG
jgi:glucokinase